MPIVILVAGVGLLAAAAGAAATAAALLRRERDELDDVFAEARGHARELDAGQALWSSLDLAGLRDGVAAIDPHDPFATLIRASSPVSWHVASKPNGSNGSDANGTQPQPVAEGKAVVWRAPGEAPVIILVVGVGFIGDSSASVTTAGRLRWDDLQNVFAQAREDTYPHENASGHRSSIDVAVVDTPDSSVPPNGAGSRISWHDGSTNGSEPKRIAWRAPAELTATQ